MSGTMGSAPAPDGRIARAKELMSEALRLLDEAKLEAGAAHLQMAFDKVGRPPCEPPADEGLGGDHEALALPPNADLVRAIGGAFSVFMLMLARKEIATFEEVGKLLGLYSVSTAQTAPEEGLILGCWSGMLLDLDDTNALDRAVN